MPRLSYVLYGGTAVALHLGHRQSVDFDFFRYEPLDKDEIRRTLAFAERATVIQDSPTALAFLAPTVSGLVKLSFFGGLRIGRLREPLRTAMERCWSPRWKISWRRSSRRPSIAPKARITATSPRY